MVLKGYFQFQNNNLYYHPSSEERNKLPHKIRILGKWKLDRSHTLIFLVDKSQNDTFGNTIKFAALIDGAGGNYLRFSLRHRETPRLRKLNKISLKGFWHIDRANRLVFSVKRDKINDEIVLRNRWQVNQNNYIIYGYKNIWGRKTSTASFILKGTWHIKPYRLFYALENSQKSIFSFRIFLTRTILRPQSKKITFTIGAEGKRGQRRALSLWGRWRAGKEGVEFLIKLGRGSALWKFKIKKNLSKDKEVVFSLINGKGKSLGYEVTLLKKFTRGGHFFLRGKLGRAKGAEAGFYFPF